MNLIIIANGFDLNEGLDTSYYDFKKYLECNNPKLLESLEFFYDSIYSGVDNNDIANFDISITSDGEIFKLPKELGSLDNLNLWNNLEKCIAFPSYESIRRYFGIGKFPINNYDEILKEVPKVLDKTLTTLKLELKNWIKTINTQSLFHKTFKGENKYLSFNYTTTLEDRYGVKAKDICYIHNSRRDEELVFGCSFKNIYQFTICKPDYIVNEALTNKLQEVVSRKFKDTENIIKNKLKPFIDDYEFDNIYIFGSSLSDVDDPYFNYLIWRYPNANWVFTYYYSKDSFGIVHTDKSEKEKYVNSKNIKHKFIKEINLILNNLVTNV